MVSPHRRGLGIKMALTVIQAFNEFLNDSVNLDPEEVKLARVSRAWLLDQIAAFPTKDATFPKLYEEKNIPFGSFSRSTKKRPLDDIDVMIGIWADGSTYLESIFSTTISIEVTNPSSNLKRFCNDGDGANTLNSIKVVNKLVSALQGVPQYSKAEIKRNQEAAVVRLTSYDWDFDIVPFFFTKPDATDKSFYLIPDGKGSWKKTDPRIDHDRCDRINSYHDKNILRLIRTMKYWNKRPTMPSMGSYLLESMILDYYGTKLDKASQFVDLEIPSLLQYISINVYGETQDPKGIQGNINNLSFEEKQKISARALADKGKSDLARVYEKSELFKASIEKWGEVFGDNFPSFG